jgi:hypothetical protein
MANEFKPPDLDSLTGVLKDLGILDKLKSKLFNLPEDAAKELEEVITIIADTYQVIGDAMTELMSLTFEDDKALRKSKKFLFYASSGFLGKRIEAARAKCTYLEFIYHDFFKGWFSNLDQDEQEKLRILFEVTFRDFDTIFKDKMLDTEDFLKESATKILERVQEGDIQQAATMVNDLSKSAKLKMDNFERATRPLLRLQSDYVKLSRHDPSKDKPASRNKSRWKFW